MKIQIRQNVFETNSSSTHSISISSETRIIPKIEGILELYGDEFGWGEETHYDFKTKANYLVSDYFHDDIKMDMLREVLIEETGCEDVIIDNQGYVDHQSSGTSSEAFWSKDNLKDFLFCPNSYIEIDNDNH